MLRRIFKNPDGGSISSMLLPGCASLVVPILAVTALEIPAAAIDKIAAPVLGRSHDVARLFRTPVAEGGDGGRPHALAFGGTLILPGRSSGGSGSSGAVGLSLVLPPAADPTSGKVAPWADDWVDPAGDAPGVEPPGTGSDPGVTPDGGEDSGAAPAAMVGRRRPNRPRAPATAGRRIRAALATPVTRVLPQAILKATRAIQAATPVRVIHAVTTRARRIPISRLLRRPPTRPKAAGSGNAGGNDGGAGGTGADDGSTTAPDSPSGGTSEGSSDSTPGGTEGAGGDGGNDQSGAPGNSGSTPGHDDGSPGNSGNAPGQNQGDQGNGGNDQSGAPGNSGSTPGHDDGSPGNSGNAPGQNQGDQGNGGNDQSGAPGNSGSTPGHDDGSPGNSGNAPGQNQGDQGNGGNGNGGNGQSGAPGNSGYDAGSRRRLAGELGERSGAQARSEIAVTQVRRQRGEPRATAATARPSRRALLGSDSRHRRRDPARVHPPVRTEPCRADRHAPCERRRRGRRRQAPPVGFERADLWEAVRSAGQALRRTRPRRRDTGIGNRGT